MLLFVYGDDPLRVKERTEDLKKKFLEKYDPTGMNVDDFGSDPGVDLEVGHVLQAVQAAPFLSEKRLVVVRDLVSSMTKAESKPWVEGLSRVPSSTVMIFADTVGVAELEKKELFKALSALPEVHKYPLQKLEGAELTLWAKDRVVKLGLVITPTLLQDVISRTKEDAWRVDAELQKLAAYANGEQVTAEMVSLLVRADVEADIFGFMDALASPSPSKAIKKLEDERTSGADDFQLYGMLLRQLRLLIQAREVIEKKPNATKQDIATAISVHPFVAQKLLSEVKGWSKDELSRAHALALKLDRAMKSGIKPEISVDRLVSEWLI